MLYCMKSKGTLCSRNRSVCFTHKKVCHFTLWALSSCCSFVFCRVHVSFQIAATFICHCHVSACSACHALSFRKHHGRGVRPWTYIYVSAWLQMSCAVNNATSGGGKVLSVARLEMVKYRTKGSKWSYLEDNYRVSGNTEIGRPMTVLSTVRARARRWNVREIPFPKLVRA